ncbi:MAG: shikimate kinase [Planctomycetes bacterium]|nr:shikimate kinase [Planctomycetota bacterium]
MDRRRCIILVGMPGAGKSTVGVLLAKQLARPFVDIDLLIQARDGRRLQAILDADGPEAFTRCEEQTVLDLPLTNQVVATGGSVVYSEKAMTRLAAAGPVVYLRIDLASLQRRLTDLKTRGIVMGRNTSLAELYAERRVLYERWATATVDCAGLNHQETVDAVVRALQHPG